MIETDTTKAARLLGARGGKATARLMSAEDKRSRARKGSAARWRKYRKGQRRMRKGGKSA